MSTQFEYTVVMLPNTPFKTRERDATELINQVAAHGWRLISVANSGGNLATTFGYFERPAPSDA